MRYKNKINWNGGGVAIEEQVYKQRYANINGKREKKIVKEEDRDEDERRGGGA